MAGLKSKIHKILVATKLNIIADPLYVALFGKKLPLVWMDEAEDHKVSKLRDSNFGAAYGPDFFGKAQNVAKVSLPEICCYSFEKARISINSSSVIEKEQKIYLERVNSIEQSVGDYAIGHIYRHDNLFARVKNGRNCEKNFKEQIVSRMVS